MGLLNQIKQPGFDIQIDPPKVYCKVFVDNSRAFEMARLPKLRHRTKHINQSYNFFNQAVERNEVSIVASPMENQLADMLTKPLPEEPFMCHQKTVLGL